MALAVIKTEMAAVLVWAVLVRAAVIQKVAVPGVRVPEDPVPMGLLPAPPEMNQARHLLGLARLRLAVH